jgi:2-haloacid dehalogenase
MPDVRKSESRKPELDRSRYRTLSFDCYGTLIDWENGILGFLQPLFESHDVHVIDEWVLEYFAEVEPEEQARGGSYREVLGRVLERYGTRLAFTASEEELAAFPASIEYWQPFEDSVAALRTLRESFALVALSNVDEDLFELSDQLLGRPFERLIAAGRVGAYKPDKRMFEALLEETEGPHLHVAQSRFHDILPASTLGLDTVWINRPTLGAARPVDAEPTWTFDSMAEFAAAWR